jgi:hypothetical protein
VMAQLLGSIGPAVSTGAVSGEALRGAVERIGYDGRTRRVSVRLREAANEL